MITTDEIEILFYTTVIHDGIATLPEQEAHHVTSVLRKGIGDSLFFMDGKGGLYKAMIAESGKKQHACGSLNRFLSPALVVK